MNDDRRLRLAIVATHPIQYHVFRWRALAAQADLDVTVLYCKREGSVQTFSEEFQTSFVWDIPMLAGYRCKFFRNWSRKRRGFLSVANPGLWWELLRGNYDAVYFLGNNLLTHTVGAAIARACGKTALLYAVCHDLDPRSRRKAVARNLAYRGFYRLFQRILFIGTHSRAHYQRAGVGGEKLTFAPHIVDNDFFVSQTAGMGPQDAKARFGIAAGARVMLFCAKMYEIKRPELLLDAFVDADLDGWVLLMVGDGVDRAALEAAASRRAPGRVVFTGFLNQTEIGAAYRAADVHVLPSRSETWGLVVNESLNFGCAQIVSDAVGCAPDLVADKTGEVFPSGDKGALTAILRTLNTEPEKWRRYRAAAPTVLRTFNVARYVAGVRAALGLPATAPAAATDRREAA